jgi:hypothetical protein
MELSCVIAGVSQDMSLEENITTTFLLIRLPDGQQIRAAIDDTAAAAVVGLSVAQSGPPRSAMRTPSAALSTPPVAARVADTYEDTADEINVPQPMPPMWPEANGHTEDAPKIFGGQDGGDEPTPDPTPPPPPAIQRQKNGKVVVPAARSVPKNEFGYPVVQQAGVDTRLLTSKNNQDEDGVGSV